MSIHIVGDRFTQLFQNGKLENKRLFEHLRDVVERNTTQIHTFQKEHDRNTEAIEQIRRST